MEQFFSIEWVSYISRDLSRAGHESAGDRSAEIAQ